MVEHKAKDIVADIAKGIAVISIVSAHCATVPESSNSICKLLSVFLDNFGTIGVGIFFFFTGFFVSKSNRKYLEFIKRKIKSIVIPWFFCGTLVYFYVYLRKGGLSIFSWCKWIIGNETYLYFMTVVSIFYLLLYGFRRSIIFNYLCSIFSIVSILLTQFTNILSSLNPYLNPFNFVIWYSLGIIFAQHKEEFYGFCKKTKIITLIISIIVFLILVFFHLKVTYVNWIYLPLEMISLCAIIGFSHMDKMFGKISELGQFSFSIYLLHMPIAGILTNITNRFCIWPVVIVRPLIVTALTFAFVWLIKKCTKGKLNKLCCVLFGVR